MAATRRPTPPAASFITRNPEGAIVALAGAAAVLLGAMMPPPVGTNPSVRSIGSRVGPLPAGMPFAAPALTPHMLETTVALPPVDQAAADAAFAINLAMPLSTSPNPVAAPFLLTAGDAASRARALDCLTAAIFYEAAGESDAGQAAVAQVVLNRVRDPSYPKSVCAVVFDGTADHAGGGCQFTFTCDGAMARVPSSAGWARARHTAAAALGGAVVPAVGLSTHYHTQWVAPAWAPTLLKTAVIGAHIFYRPPSSHAVARYAGVEPEIVAMMPLSSVPMTALAAVAAPPAAAPEPAASPPDGRALALVMPGI